MSTDLKVMIAGIAGASLGTEILKCLLLANRYTVFGCDISPMAYGHYQEGFRQTYVVDRENYVESVLDACRKQACDFIVPGAEQPMTILAQAKHAFEKEGVRVAINSPKLISLCSDKLVCFEALAKHGFRVPLTFSVSSQADLNEIPFPCMIKPATGSGGSVFAFLATEKQQAVRYVEYLLQNGVTPLLQEYISEDEGEFTIGVLSLPSGEVACSVALKRLFDSKLSILFRSKAGLISTGYSQGLIDDFPELRKTAEAIAIALGSTGPINVQGRVHEGIFMPFEINPRFSASTYLRALAGINEIDMYLQHVASGTIPVVPHPRPGLYLRSLAETFVPKELVRK